MLKKNLITSQGSLLNNFMRKNEIYYLNNDLYNNILWKSKKNNITKTKKLESYKNRFLKIK
jgi:hypothetical protein